MGRIAWSFARALSFALVFLPAGSVWAENFNYGYPFTCHVNGGMSVRLNISSEILSKVVDVTVEGVSVADLEILYDLNSYVPYSFLRFVAPPHSAGLADVELQMSEGGKRTVLDAMLYLETPQIETIDPVAVSSDGGNEVELHIAGVSHNPPATVTVDGVAVDKITFDDLDAERALVTVPAHAPGLARISVMNPDGSSDAADLNYESFSIEGVDSRSRYDEIKILGHGLKGSGYVATVGGLPTRYTFVQGGNAFQIITAIGNQSPGIVPVSLATPEGPSIDVPGGFTFRESYNDNPWLASPFYVSNDAIALPSSGWTDSAITLFRDISGQDAVATLDGLDLEIGSLIYPDPFVYTRYFFEVNWPPHAPGFADLQVSIPSFGTDRYDRLVRYLSAPHLQNVEPRICAGKCAGGIEITGLGIAPGASVFMGNQALQITKRYLGWWGGGGLTVSEPDPLPAGIVRLSVVNPDGLEDQITFLNEILALESVSPGNGLTKGGETVTLLGRGFSGETATVLFGGTPATGVEVSSRREITCIAPSHLPGLVDVSVTVSGETQTLSNAYLYEITIPTLGGVAPDFGPTTGGTAVSLTGSDFGVGGTPTVLFGAVAATDVLVGADGGTLTCVAPPNAAGSLDVTVTNPDGGTVSVAGAYRYGTPPPNDVCENAIALEMGNTYLMDDTFASSEGPVSCRSASTNDVWFTFQPLDRTYLYSLRAVPVVPQETTPRLAIEFYDSCGGNRISCSSFYARNWSGPTLSNCSQQPTVFRIAHLEGAYGQYNVYVDTIPQDGPSPDCLKLMYHSSDSDLNGKIGLSELLRAIQIFHSGGYECAKSTEDGYAPGVGNNHSCAPHDLDYAPQDWRISLPELLRLIQFYNALGYHYCPADGTEDGFCPGPL